MKKQVWLITGCSKGIGLAIAKQAYEAGHQVIATARRIEDLTYLPENEHVLKCKLDVTKLGEIEAVAQSAINRYGKIDVLVNNAGYGLEGAFEELEREAIFAQFETNFFGLLDMTRAVLPYMRNQNSGYIFNISSIAGMRGIAGMSIYNASKFAVTGFSEALANELEPFGIQVVCVAPGPYRTEWAGKSLHKSYALASLSTDSPYFDLNKRVSEYLSQADGNQPGDPYQIASVLLGAAQQPKLPVHIVFGDVALQIFQTKLEKYQSEEFFQFYKHDEYEFRSTK